MFKRALVSTSDKTGLIELLKPLVKAGCKIVSTGGTSKYLRDNSIPVTEVSEVTGFPEMMDGRVRTLHPKIHMGLLARSHVVEDMKLLKEYDVEPFDLVVVNLYPFEQAYKKSVRGPELIEQIDIGGPSLLRAAAKSFERITVVCDPTDYKLVHEMTTQNQNSLETRKELAAKVYRHCSYYDGWVSQALSQKSWEEQDTLNLGLRKKSNLRYGENAHQKAVWYESSHEDSLSLTRAHQLQGKELSYNNILDLEAAIGTVCEYSEPTAVIIKHLTPCGVACASQIETAYTRAFDADSVSAFGGIVALNRKITAPLAEKLAGPFLECVIAPGIDSDGLSKLNQKKNLRVLTLENLDKEYFFDQRAFEVKSLRGGALIQSLDRSESWNSQWKIVGPVPSKNIQDDLVFAQKVVRHVKSNAIVVVKDMQTLGICGGQTNRVDSVKWALERAKGKGKDLVLGSDAFFPFRDSIDLAAKGGVRWVIQPGGSLRDAEVETAAQEYGLGMVITGVRHFKH